MKNLKSTLSFFQRLRQRLFRHSVDFEIFRCIFPHLFPEANGKGMVNNALNYPFVDQSSLAAETDALDSRELLELVEKQIRSMPKAYGDAFRYVMHRDIHTRLMRYARLSQRRIPRENKVAEFARNCV